MIERRRTYVNTHTGQTSLSYLDVLPKHLQLNVRYTHDKEHKGSTYRWKWHQRLSDETLFQGIEVLPDPPIITSDQLPPRGSTSITDLLTSIRNSVTNYWRPDQFHVIMHSSGYDSRLLSAILQQTGITDLLFVCTKIEGESFKRIMEFEGWPKSSYVVYNESTPMDEYFDSIRDFQNAHLRLGGVARVPVNLFWYTVAGLQRQGLCPEDAKIDMWHTQYSDTVLSNLGAGSVQSFNDIWSTFRHHNIRTRPFKCAREFSPWLDLDVIKTVGGLHRESIPATGLDAPQFKIQLCEMVREGLGGFKNDHGWGDERIEISKNLSASAHRSYSRSWYGQQIVPLGTPPTNTQFSNYWEHWTSASLCDHLLRNGYDISH